MSEIGDPIIITPPSTTRVRGVTLRGTPGEVSGDGEIVTTLQWMRGGSPISGATGADYTTTDADAGAVVSLRQTSTGPGGSATRDSEQQYTINGAPPTIPANPTVSGTPQRGQTLTATLATPTGTPTIVSSVQWYQNGFPLSGATSLSYTVGSGLELIGAQIWVRHIATSTWGSDDRESDPVTIVSAPVSTSAPTLSSPGIYIGGGLSFEPGTWAGTAPITLSYTVRRDGVAIPGLTGLTQAQAISALAAYELVAADIGPALTIQEVATNAHGSASSVSNSLSYNPHTQPAWLECWDAAAGLTIVATGAGLDDSAATGWVGRVTGALLEPPSEGARPQVLTSVSPALRFDGSSDRLVGPIGGTIAAGSSHTILVVMGRRDATPGGGPSIAMLGTAPELMGGDPSPVSQLRHAGVGELAMQVRVTSISTSTGGTALPLGQVASVAAIRNSASTGSEVQVWKNGAQLAGGGSPGSGNSMDILALGATLLGTDYSELDLAFVGLASRAFSASDWQNWNAYASWRWGIAI